MADGNGGRMKLNVHTKVIYLGRNLIIVQDARSFCQLAETLYDKNIAIYESEEIQLHTNRKTHHLLMPIKGTS